MGLLWLLYILAGVLGATGLWLLYRSLFADRSRGRRRCPKCWYDMGGVPGLKCPECGRVAKSERGLLKTRKRRLRACGAIVLLLAAVSTSLAPGVIRNGWRASVPLWSVLLVMEVYDTPSLDLRDFVLTQASPTYAFLKARGGAGAALTTLDPPKMSGLSRWMLARFGARLLLAPLKYDINSPQYYSPENQRDLDIARQMLASAGDRSADFLPELAPLLQETSIRREAVLALIHELGHSTPEAVHILTHQYERSRDFPTAERLFQTLRYLRRPPPTPVQVWQPTIEFAAHAARLPRSRGYWPGTDAIEMLQLAEGLEFDSVRQLIRDLLTNGRPVDAAAVLVSIGASASMEFQEALCAASAAEFDQIIQQVGTSRKRANWCVPLVIGESRRRWSRPPPVSLFALIRRSGRDDPETLRFLNDVVHDHLSGDVVRANALEALWSNEPDRQFARSVVRAQVIGDNYNLGIVAMRLLELDTDASTPVRLPISTP